ncbi:MAG: hypothetical protein AAGD25_33420 [Cyanobacteria bacterium P01_F01_bin.150]
MHPSPSPVLGLAISTKAFKDSLSSSNRDDFYRFELNTLNGAEATLFFDINGDGAITDVDRTVATIAD